MNETKNRKILRLAVKTYGKEAQIDMVIEELLELSFAIRKLRRKDSSLSEFVYFVPIIEEIADVEIMIEQLEIMLPLLYLEKYDYNIAGVRIEPPIHEDIDRKTRRVMFNEIVHKSGILIGILEEYKAYKIDPYMIHVPLWDLKHDDFQNDGVFLHYIKKYVDFLKQFLNNVKAIYPNHFKDFEQVKQAKIDRLEKRLKKKNV